MSRVAKWITSDGSHHVLHTVDLAQSWMAELEVAIRSNDQNRELTARRELLALGIETTLSVGTPAAV